MTNDHDPHDFEPPHTSSPTAEVLDDLALHGYRPRTDEPDPRALPEPAALEGAIADVFDALASVFSDTCLEPDLADLLWSTVNVFHRMAQRAQRTLDDNEDAQKKSQRVQDGSEIRSVELERLLADGEALLERRNTFEACRDHAGDLFETHTGSAWRPYAGSHVNRRALTAAMIDSRDFLSAKRRSENEVLMPAGSRIAFTGGPQCNDHQQIWAALDRLRAKHPDMVLLHGGTPTGAERIAACWADHRKVPQIAFKPDWKRHQKAAPFKRNDQMLEAMPIGVVVFPGSGISGNLADKARQLGIPVWRFDQGGASAPPCEPSRSFMCAAFDGLSADWFQVGQAPSEEKRGYAPTRCDTISHCAPRYHERNGAWLIRAGSGATCPVAPIRWCYKSLVDAAVARR